MRAENGPRHRLHATPSKGHAMVEDRPTKRQGSESVQRVGDFHSLRGNNTSHRGLPNHRRTSWRWFLTTMTESLPSTTSMSYVVASVGGRTSPSAGVSVMLGSSKRTRHVPRVVLKT